MMKKITLFMFVTGQLAIFTATAQKPLNRDKRLRLQTAAMYSMPLGSFSDRQQEISLLGQAKNSFGAEAVISVPVYHDWILGFAVNYCRYHMAGQQFLDYQQSRYGSNDHFVTYYTTEFYDDMSQAGLQASRNFRLHGIEIEPYVRLAMGFHGDYPTVSVRRKMKNDNYEERIVSNYSGNGHDFLYPSVGVHFNKDIGDFIYLVGGLQLMTGQMHVEAQEVTTGIYGDVTTKKYTLTQTVSAFQVSLGIQFRTGRR